MYSRLSWRTGRWSPTGWGNRNGYHRLGRFHVQDWIYALEVVGRRTIWIIRLFSSGINNSPTGKELFNPVGYSAVRRNLMMVIAIVKERSLLKFQAGTRECQVQRISQFIAIESPVIGRNRLHGELDQFFRKGGPREVLPKDLVVRKVAFLKQLMYRQGWIRFGDSGCSSEQVSRLAVLSKQWTSESAWIWSSSSKERG